MFWIINLIFNCLTLVTRLTVHHLLKPYYLISITLTIIRKIWNKSVSKNLNFRLPDSINITT